MCREMCEADLEEQDHVGQHAVLEANMGPGMVPIGSEAFADLQAGFTNQARHGCPSAPASETAPMALIASTSVVPM